MVYAQLYAGLKARARPTDYLRTLVSRKCAHVIKVGDSANRGRTWPIQPAMLFRSRSRNKAQAYSPSPRAPSFNRASARFFLYTAERDNRAKQSRFRTDTISFAFWRP